MNRKKQEDKRPEPELLIGKCKECGELVCFAHEWNGLCNSCDPAVQDFLRDYRTMSTPDVAQYLTKTSRMSQPKARISDQDRWAVWERDNFTCQHCGTRRNLTIDHIVPESKGGASTVDNYQTLCKSCNSRKGTKL